ncbi:hypothetical protein CSUI_002177 [Cystoisospora suis]|uniref:Transmembrane protein n=1 Tax=Cystoisospora suis TaxID=483139 RepID=A0A2C6L9Y4_9APIC|nr:hypothetical protein CSUI_002177 [Cystoisospora suis]
MSFLVLSKVSLNEGEIFFFFFFSFFLSSHPAFFLSFSFFLCVCLFVNLVYPFHFIHPLSLFFSCLFFFLSFSFSFSGSYLTS